MNNEGQAPLTHILGKGLAIFGAGGFGREVAWLARKIYGDGIRMSFLVNRPDLVGSVVNGILVSDVEKFAANAPGTPTVVGIGDPKGRQACTEICKSFGLQLVSLVHPGVEASETVSVGRGSVVCAGSILTTEIRIEEHVQINLNCTVGHDVEIGEFSTLAPGVHVSGRVRLGKRVYVGSGAVIINGTEDRPLVVGDDAVIGAGACVIRNVESQSLMVGVPAVRKN